MADPDDEFRGFQFPLLISRSSWDEPGDFGVLVLYLQHRPDTLEGEAHIDIEVLCATWREVIRVWIVLLRERVGVNLKHILSVVLIQSTELILVSAREGVGDFRLGLVCEDETQCLILESLTPAIIEFCLVGRPGHGGVIDNKVFVYVVVKPFERGRQRVEDALETGFEFGMVSIEYGECGGQVTATTGVVQFQSPLIKLTDVVGVEKHSLRVERIQIRDKMLGRETIIVAPARVVTIFDHVDQFLEGVTLPRSGGECGGPEGAPRQAKSQHDTNQYAAVM